MKKKLKILLTNAWLEHMLGSEQFVFTITEELKKRGHEVTVFSYLQGIMSEAFNLIGIKTIHDTSELKEKYDLILVNHNGCLINIPKGFKIFTSHSPFVEIEQPIVGADRYVGISEEVCNNLWSYGFRPIIIYNPVNLERFKSVKPINKELKNVLLLSNKSHPQTKEFHVIVSACEELGLNLNVVGLGSGTAQWEVEKHINTADLVISMGRGIYESMAVGRNCVVAGYGKLAGFVDNKSYFEFRKWNCSGRIKTAEDITVQGLIKEFKKYNTEQGEKNRKLAEKYHSVEKIVDNYLKIYSIRSINI